MIRVLRTRCLQALVVALVLCLGQGFTHAAEPSIRLVSLGGSVTEIVYALGADRGLVGVDQSSLYPPQAQALPSVGYYRRLPPEGVASLKPTLVVASDKAGPPQVIAQLRLLNIPVLRVSDEPTVQSLHERVRAVAHALGKTHEANTVLNTFDQALSEATSEPMVPLSAMMIVMRGGKLLGAGGDTAAHAVLSLAGLNNAFSAHMSYQPISAEAMSTLAPEVLVVTASTVESVGGLAALKSQPALRLTPAVRNDRVVVLDDLLAQGFGLRLPQAIKQIRQGAKRESHR